MSVAGRPLAAEFAGTFMMVWCGCGAIAADAAILLEAAFAGPISGASMNPARSLAPALVSGSPEARANLWPYFAGPIAGALAAVPLHRFTHPSSPHAAGR